MSDEIWLTAHLRDRGVDHSDLARQLGTSAAVLHRLPVWKSDLGRVHVTRNRSNGARRRTLVEVHGAPLEGV